MKGQTRPYAVPRQPVLSWTGLGTQFVAGIPAVTDGRDFMLTCSGRSAIVLALRQLGVGSGDHVLLPNYYCPTMIAPIELLDAKPVFYPIGEDRRPDLSTFSTELLGKARAMLAVHFFGLPLDLRSVRELCDRFGIALIEDCAHAYFGIAGDQPIGGAGDLSIASLPKFFPTVFGGALVSGRRPLATEPNRLPGPGLRGSLGVAWTQFQLATECGRLPGLNWLGSTLQRMQRWSLRPGDEPLPPATTTEPAESTRTSAMTDPLLTPVALSVADWVAMRCCSARRLITNRRRNYRFLSERLERSSWGHPLFADLPDGAVPYVFPLFLRDPEPAYRALRELRLPVFRWDRYWPGAISDERDVGRRWGHHVIQLACHQDLTESELQQVVRTVTSAYERAGHAIA